MSESDDGDPFYASVPVFEGFDSLMEPGLYRPLPDDWTIGVADIVDSTKAIRANNYKAVNMAGAAVIAAVKNALNGRDFPYAFGGDGASFGAAAQDLARARDALAATAAWAQEELGLVMRIALIPLAALRAEGVDVRVARFAPSPHVCYAMFSGGGLEWADAEARRGRFAIAPAPPGARPDLNGLSCRFEEMPAARGVILSVLILPAGGADQAAFRAAIEEILALVAGSPEMSKPVPPEGPRMRWPSAGAELEARAAPGAKTPLFLRRGAVLGRTLFYFLVLRYGIRVGAFRPATYLRQVVENSDFRKFADGLRMILDCAPDLADAIERRLLASAGTVCFGLHRQDAAVMTCFSPSPADGDHFHFIDGARGGYAFAATALKAMSRAG
jgi:hypothetical protein